MRLLVQATAAFAIIAFPVFAQTAAPAAPPPAASASPATARTPRVPLAQRFAEANTTKDGHLTQDQANANNWYYVSRNFVAIDAAHKGFVTIDDIRNHAREVREQRRAAAPAAAPSKS